MGYHVVDPAALSAAPDRPCDKRAIGDAAGLENVAINRYTAEPGEQLPLAYHVHAEQEEAFYVLEGTLHVETPEREYTVPAGQCFVVEPDSPQRAYNPATAEGTVRALAIGAPPVDDASVYDPEQR